MINEPVGDRKILVIESIEDDTALRHAIRDRFTREGFKVIEAADGEDGLAKALSERPDLILLDLILPKIDGITVMKKLRHADEWGKKVPIILLTNVPIDDNKIIQAVVENNPTYYLIKSDWKMSDLVEKIREKLAR